MQIQKMLLAAQAAVDLGEVPTVEQVMATAEALHAMTVRMPEFLWFDKTFEDMGDTACAAGKCFDSEVMPGFGGARAELDALSLYRVAA